MALKAGTVGIDPKYVDKNGKPISEAADLSNYYTKSETDTKLDLKANLSYLTANNKKFQFAYDSESGKYGYKAGAQDDFHPFESAGGAGWVKPADISSAGITLNDDVNAEIVDGGYCVDEDNNVYVDITVHQTGGAGNSIKIPLKLVHDNLVCGAYSDSATTVNDYCATTYKFVSVSTDYFLIGFGNVSDVGRYTHYWGMFKKATT